MSETQSSVLDQAVEAALREVRANGQVQDHGDPPAPPDPPAEDHREDKPDDARTTLSPPEIAYWKQVQVLSQEAEAQVRQAQILEAQAADLRQQATMKMGAYESFVQFAVKYHEFDMDTERLDPEGQIVKIEQTPRQ